MSNSPPFNLLEEEEEENKDKFSNLPDDILVFILSLIDIKDATRSSILSRRWRNMATYIMSLHFCVSLSDTRLSKYWCEQDNEKQRYMDWVNQGDDKDLNIPSFPNVKHLELRAVFTFHGNLLPLMGFAEACLLLHDLKLEIYWISSSCLNVASDSESGSEYESDLVRRTHQMQSQKQNQIQSLT
ncbi:F-box/LRR-repeat protein At1g48400 isoform X1 [Beta vulgaris subsp. vulgaris]|uniref:F-box/LRR-repeat protein At1g48400 isoform X1 n=1 Tax=Beta vulgaris subsp. vulgaris TaxID=3555 RepID=UPI002036E032|nr:F-box/LRR-repeat protein At1g48400 isoform X1 [Beta vulgaris subsp. vulgaris]